MKIWPVPLLLIGGYGLFAPQTRAPKSDVLVIYGNLAGYLSPCGCTYPMSGGIQRFGSFVKELESQGNHSLTLVMPGGNVEGSGLQSGFKADCVAETASALGTSALGFSVEEAELGQGADLEMSQLSRDILVSSSLQHSDRISIKSEVQSGAFVIGAISPQSAKMSRQLGIPALPGSTSMLPFTAAEQPTNLMPVVCFDADQQQAEVFAKKYPQIKVLVYRSTSDPPSSPETIGNTLLVTPGFHGKSAIVLSFEDGTLRGYSVHALGPDFKNDPEVSAIYSDYLHRVDAAHLLQSLPKFKTGIYAGSQACRSCHEKAFEIWAGSGHAHAYKDLSAQGHGLDPDCVSCHVVGLSSKSGFSEVGHTPQFANVGCESCHGPGGAHELDPRKVAMPAVKPTMCVSCHTVENSPGFDYKSFWPKVAH